MLIFEPTEPLKILGQPFSLMGPGTILDMAAPTCGWTVMEKEASSMHAQLLCLIVHAD